MSEHEIASTKRGRPPKKRVVSDTTTTITTATPRANTSLPSSSRRGTPAANKKRRYTMFDEGFFDDSSDSDDISMGSDDDEEGDSGDEEGYDQNVDSPSTRGSTATTILLTGPDAATQPSYSFLESQEQSSPVMGSSPILQTQQHLPVAAPLSSANFIEQGNRDPSSPPNRVLDQDAADAIIGMSQNPVVDNNTLSATYKNNNTSCPKKLSLVEDAVAQYNKGEMITTAPNAVSDATVRTPRRKAAKVSLSPICNPRQAFLDSSTSVASNFQKNIIKYDTSSPIDLTTEESPNMNTCGTQSGCNAVKPSDRKIADAAPILATNKNQANVTVVDANEKLSSDIQNLNSKKISTTAKTSEPEESRRGGGQGATKNETDRKLSTKKRNSTSNDSIFTGDSKKKRKMGEGSPLENMNQTIMLPANSKNAMTAQKKDMSSVSSGNKNKSQSKAPTKRQHPNAGKKGDVAPIANDSVEIATNRDIRNKEQLCETDPPVIKMTESNANQSTTSTGQQAPQTTKKKKKMSFQDRVLNHMALAFKPFTIKILAEALQTTETTLEYLMLSLVDKNVVIKKEFSSAKGGRTKTLYWANSDVRSKECGAVQFATEAERKAAHIERSQLRQDIVSVNNVLVNLLNGPSNADLAKELVVDETNLSNLQNAVRSMKDRIAQARNSKNSIDHRGRNISCGPRQMKLRINAMRKEWKKRKEMCMDFIDQLADGMEKKPKDVLKLLDIETDEMYNVQMPPLYPIDDENSKKNNNSRFV